MHQYFNTYFRIFFLGLALGTLPFISSAFAATTVATTVAAPAALTYAPNPATYLKGVAIANNNPSHSGGVVTTYGVSPALPAGLSLNMTTGVISGTPSIVSSATAYHIMATNAGGSTTATLNITVNDNVPTSLAYPANPANYIRGIAIANNTPTHAGGAITAYTVSPALPTGLILNATTGIISGTASIATPLATYTVTARNAVGATTAALRLAVIEVAPATLSYANNAATYIKGAAIPNNLPTNSGGFAIRYAVSPALPAGLVLNTTNGVISGVPTVNVLPANYTVTASNAAGNTTKVIQITVNDPAPVSLSYSNNPAAYIKGTAIANNTPSHGGGAILSYSISPPLPPGLALNPVTGVISGVPAATATATNHTIVGRIYTGGTTAVVKITVWDSAPTSLAYFHPSSNYLKDRTIENNMPSHPPGRVSGGAITRYAVSPALPLGLNLDQYSGVISGTPTVITAPTNFTVTGANEAGSITTVIRIAVNDIPPSALSYSGRSMVYTKGIAIANNTPSRTGGVITNFSVNPALPAGLSLNATTGVISGIPTAVAPATSYTISGYNISGTSITSIQITVNDAAPTALNYPTNPAVYSRGVSIAANTPTNTGGDIATFSVSPTLPSGLAMDPGTGTISGTPSVFGPATNYTITGSNASGSTSATVRITINP